MRITPALVESVAQKHYNILKEEAWKLWRRENPGKPMPVWMLPHIAGLDHIERALRMGWMDEEGRMIPATSPEQQEAERLHFNTFRE